MQTQNHPLEPFFHQAVRSSYEGKLGIYDPEIIRYVSKLLCEFSESNNLYKLHDSAGRPVTDLADLVKASDPVYGSAASFDAERAMRKYIGDYALFVAGMYPEPEESVHSRHARRPSSRELIEVGKESYAIVSQFNLFEYEEEAPLFARLADRFERCVLGLKLVREEMDERKLALTPPAQQ